jgi:hypothetical protein
MKRCLLITGITVASVLGFGAPAFAANPHDPGTSGQPSKSCQDFSATTRPGLSYLSLGSPFNEPVFNSPNGGIGGAHYSETSQYDVACFQVASH